MKQLLFTVLLMIFAFVCQAQTRPAPTQIQEAGRVIVWSKITIDSLPYTKDGSHPFSLMIVPKSGANTTEVTTVQARPWYGKTARVTPVSVNQWNVTLILSMPTHALNTTLFTDYDVWVGFGKFVNGL